MSKISTKLLKIAAIFAKSVDVCYELIAVTSTGFLLVYNHRSLVVKATGKLQRDNERAVTCQQMAVPEFILKINIFF